MSAIKGLDMIVNAAPNAAIQLLWGDFDSKESVDLDGLADDLFVKPLTYVFVNVAQSAAVGFATGYAIDNAYISVAASALTFVGALGTKVAKLYHEE